MNPSTNNGGPSVPGVKPGMIASGPEPAGPSMPGATPGTIASGPEPGASAAGISGMARRPTGGRPGGDIILNAGTTSRRKTGGPNKGIVIGGILIIIAMILGVAAVMVMPKGSSSKSGTTFNKLINYITSGAESDETITAGYDVANKYYLLNGWNSSDEKMDIYTKTKDLTDAYVSGYNAGDNEALNNLVKNVKEQFDFIYLIEFKEKNAGESIVAAAIKGRQAESVKQDLLSYYDFSSLGENIYVKGFVESYGEWVDAIFEEVKLYSENGCIASEKLNDACMVVKGDATLNEKMTELSQKINNAYSYVKPYYNMTSNYVANVYDINTKINSKAEAANE